jgi:hypothetical protein
MLLVLLGDFPSSAPNVKIERSEAGSYPGSASCQVLVQDQTANPQPIRVSPVWMLLWAQ